MKAKGVAACVLLLAALCRGAEDIESKTLDELYGSSPARSARGKGPGLLEPLGIVLLLVGAAGGGYVLLRHLSGRRALLGGRNISVLETAYLSPKHTLVLVRVRNRIFLLGLGQDVRTLASFEKPEEVMGIRGEFEREFISALNAPEESESVFEPYRRQIERLREAVGRLRGRLRGEVSR